MTGDLRAYARTVVIDRALELSVGRGSRVPGDCMRMAVAKAYGIPYTR